MRFNTSVLVFLCIICLFLPKDNAAQKWELIGLEDHIVNSIMVDIPNMTLAGTNKGLYIDHVNQEEWLEIPLADTLPVQDIIRVPQIHIIAAIGRNSNSDGIYLGTPIKGPPYYSLSLIDSMDCPQSLAVRGTNGDTLFAGGRNSIAMSLLVDHSLVWYGELKPIKIPEHSFGVEDPLCAALHVLSGDNKLYAGGYDQSQMPGPGHLLCEDNDSMVGIMQLNVSAMAEGTGLTSINQLELYCGTTDTGILVYSPIFSKPPPIIPSPNNEPVNDIIVLPPELLGRYMLCVAVKSGVYVYDTLQNNWKQLGDLPAEPSCLAVGLKDADIGDNVLYAGTKKGIYALNSAVPTIKYHRPPEIPDALTLRRSSGNIVSVEYSLQKADKVKMDILDCTGRIVKTLINAYIPEGRHTVSWRGNNMHGKRTGSGVYFVRLSTNGMRFFKKIVLAR